MVRKKKFSAQARKNMSRAAKAYWVRRKREEARDKAKLDALVQRLDDKTAADHQAAHDVPQIPEPTSAEYDDLGKLILAVWRHL